MSAGFTGEFEAHITVADEADRLYPIAEKLGLKVVHIVLEQGYASFPADGHGPQ